MSKNNEVETVIKEMLKALEIRLEAYLDQRRQELGIQVGSRAGTDRGEPRSGTSRKSYDDEGAR